MTSFDAVIIGGGHNGLAAAGILARAKRRVLVVEASDRLGGVMELAHVINRLAPQVVRGLGLDIDSLQGGLAPTVLLHPEHPPIVLRGAYGEQVDGVDGDEAARFSGLRSKLIAQASVLKRFLARRPPRPGQIGFSDMAAMAAAGIGLMRQGRAEARDFARMLLMNVADIADEYLTDDRLKGLIAFDATLGVHLGPRSPTSLLGLYYRLTGEAAGATGGQIVPAGGMAALSAAFEQAVRSAGGEIRLGSPVRRIVTEGGHSTGVILASGEEISARVVVSAIHPVTTLRTLVARGEIDTELSTRLKHVRSKGDTAKLTLTLDRPPVFPGVDAADRSGRLVIAHSVGHVETSFNPAKYGAFSADPVMEITLGHGPSGTGSASTLSAIVQWAPYDLRGGWEAGRPKLLAAILASLERHAPGISASVTASELLVPPDIEARYHLAGGHWHHGELQVDQMLLNRPTFAVSGYDTPIAGLYLASAGSHPGGGISGLPGYNAAKHILARWDA